ncbi:hypothetical protein AYK26_06705 [Euryarchaeota archaeon SM23-78]|nr:MAG: hypothetical protein AYK26_06705 [Euryarchaeota archaeon SM23-78]MBW3001192.1 hypothetical protein [Candidatus Woesearchaeota archaeon]
MDKKLKHAIKKSAKAMYKALPILLGVILLISLANTLIPKSIYSSLFSKNIFLDSIIGSALGSILAGNPITSYILGGEFLNQGISLVAVTAFIVAWVTVGIVQLPAEIMLLGKKFAITRNITAFVFSTIVAIITVVIVGLI